MTKDDNDDPFAPPRDATIFRPRPGAGKRAPDRPVPDRSAAPEPRAAAEAPRASATAFGAARSSTGASERQPSMAALAEFLGKGVSPLLQAASPLLTLVGRLRTSLSNPDITALRRQTLEQVRGFEERAIGAGVSLETTRSARYVLCSAVDEAVLSTPWGNQSEWGALTLLAALHKETWGGDKFFVMLDRLLTEPARHIDLMKLQYLCLALGFAGKYAVLDRGADRLAQIQADLYRRIRDHDGPAPQELSLHWRGMHDRRNPLIRYVPWWVIAAFTLVILTGTFIFYHVELGGLSAPIDDRLAHVGLADALAVPTTAAGTAHAAAVAAPRLRELLANDVANGVLSVEERNNRSVVTLIAPDLFSSGSATVNPKYYEALARLARALNEVPGRVFVVGHTDDQPLRSLRYRDNYDLSRARADEVIKLLSLAISNPGRLEPSGVGSSEPRYLPASLPDNRARNRRVEIIAVAEG